MTAYNFSFTKRSFEDTYAANTTFLDPKWHSLNGSMPQSPKKSQFPGPNSLPLALVMDLHGSNTLHTGPC
jgi:hypothetical protein